MSDGITWTFHGSAPRQDDFLASSAPTFPPWADPARVEQVRVQLATDRDHIGTEEIGKLGNNREVYVLTVEDADGQVLRHETFDGAEAWAEADRRREEILRTLKRNQQAFLNL